MQKTVILSALQVYTRHSKDPPLVFDALSSNISPTMIFSRGDEKFPTTHVKRSKFFLL